jgi:hypothetical protein
MAESNWLKGAFAFWVCETAKSWKEKYGNSSWPAVEVSAKFCTDAEEPFGKKYNWTFEQGSKFTDACAQGLSKEFGFK